MVNQRWMVAFYVSFLMLFSTVKAMAGEQESFDHNYSAQGFEADIKQGRFSENLQYSLQEMLQKSSELMKAKNKFFAESMMTEWEVVELYLARGSEDDIIQASRWLLGIWNTVSVSIDSATINKYRLYGIKAIAEGMIYVLAPEDSQGGFELFYKHYNNMSGPISWWVTYAACKQIIKISALEIVCSPAAEIVEVFVIDSLAPKTAQSSYNMALRIHVQRQGN